MCPGRRRHTRRARAEAAQPRFGQPRAPPQPGAEAWSIAQRAQLCGSGGSPGAPPEPLRGRERAGARGLRAGVRAGWGEEKGHRSGQPGFCLVCVPAFVLVAAFHTRPRRCPHPVPVASSAQPCRRGPRGLGAEVPAPRPRGGGGEERLGDMGRTAEGVSEAARGLSPSRGLEGDMALARDWMGRGWRWDEELGRRSEGHMNSEAPQRRRRGEGSQSPAPSQKPGMRKVSDFVTLAAKGLMHLG